MNLKTNVQGRDVPLSKAIWLHWSCPEASSVTIDPNDFSLEDLTGRRRPDFDI